MASGRSLSMSAAIRTSFVQIAGKSRRSTWQPAIFLLIAITIGIQLVGLPWITSALVLAAAALLILILAEPLFGLALALLAGPFSALESVLFGAAILNSGQLLLLLTLGSWLVRVVVRRRLVLPTTSLNVPLLIFMGTIALSLPSAASPTDGVTEVVKWIEIALVMWMVLDQAGSLRGAMLGPSPAGLNVLGKGMTRILIMLLAAGVVQALIGVWQFGLRESGPDHFGIPGGFFRAYGTFEQPNPFGGYMNLTALLALGATAGLIASFWGSRRRWIAKDTLLLGFVAGSAAVSSLALLFSWSRGAWLGFAAGAAVLIMFLSSRVRRGIALLLLIATLLIVAASLNLIPAGVVERLGDLGAGLMPGDVRGVDINSENYAIVERYAHWQAALDMARENLWLGVGLGNYAAAYRDYALINWPDALGHAHNYYLNVLAEGGVLALAAYAVMWGAILLQTLRSLGRSEWPRRGIALGLLAAWLALATHHLVDNLYVNNIYVHLGVMLGLLQLLEMDNARLGPVPAKRPGS